MTLEKIVQSSLYNWLGYGQLDGRIWFIGTEEGGAEIWRNETKTLEESLTLRSQYELAMDFSYVWEELYRIPLESFKGPCVWRYMAAFLLALDGIEPNKNNINNYVFKRKLLGSTNSGHFMCELLPLPKKCKDSILPYDSIWSSIELYREEVLSKRFEIIKYTIESQKNIELIISYEKILTDRALNYFNMKLITEWTYKKEVYLLYVIEINGDRKVYFLATPFFGNGQISYEGILKAVEKILDIVLHPKFNYVVKKGEFMTSNTEKENKNISVDKSRESGDYGEGINSKVASLLGSSFTPKYNKTGVTYFGENGRILKVVNRQNELEIQFNVPVLEVPGLTVLTEKERIKKKMGTCQWIYKGDNLSAALKLVEEAAKKY